MLKSKIIIVITAVIILSILLFTTGCRGGVSKASYEKRVAKILEEVGSKLKPNLQKLKKLSPDKKKEREKLGKEQTEILEDARSKIAKTNPPDDFFSGHSNLVEFLDLFIDYHKKQAEAAKAKKPGANDFEKRQELQEAYQEVTLAFTRASSELSFLQHEMRNAFYDLLRYQSQLGL